MSEKTHYRKAFDSPYLSSADIVEPTPLTVKQVRLELDKTKKTKDLFNTAYFVESEIRPGEKLKPMILNATNSKTLKTLTDSAFIEDWQNVPITVYVDPNVRFGKESVEGLRISEQKRSKITPELLKAATDTAGKGRQAFTEYWRELSVQDRKALESELGRLRAIAQKFDAKAAG